MITNQGIYKNLPNEVYHASQGLSNSKMKYLLPSHCPKEFWYEELSGLAQKKESPAFDIGTAVHTLVFEPLEFTSRFYCVQEMPKRNTTIGKAAYESVMQKSYGKIILDGDDRKLVVAMADSVKSHAMWKSVKGDKSGCVEDSIAWNDEESGVLLRSRPDFYTDDIIIDLKTTRDSSPGSFQKSVVDYAYHRQAALAIDGLNKLTGREYKNVVLFVVDKNPPHLVRCYVLADSAIEQGRYEYKYACKEYKKGIESGSWDSFPEVIEDLDLPQWGYKVFD